MTPYEKWTDRKPYNGYLRIFGSKTIALEKRPRINKFMSKGKEYVMVGYSQESKAYRLWERGTKHVIVRRDVCFHEDVRNHVTESDDTFIVPTNSEFNTTIINEEKEESNEEKLTKKSRKRILPKKKKSRMKTQTRVKRRLEEEREIVQN